MVRGRSSLARIIPKLRAGRACAADQGVDRAASSSKGGNLCVELLPCGADPCIVEDRRHNDHRLVTHGFETRGLSRLGLRESR
jgi:hypothetical protein